VEKNTTLSKKATLQTAMFSKVLAEKENCKVVFLAYAAGYILEPQSVCTEIICTGLEGKAILNVEGLDILLKEGVVITIPALARHSLQVQTDFKMLMIK
jgi:quercetin dioxygenase-like cupin family protein